MTAGPHAREILLVYAFENDEDIEDIRDLLQGADIPFESKDI